MCVSVNLFFWHDLFFLRSGIGSSFLVFRGACHSAPQRPAGICPNPNPPTDGGKLSRCRLVMSLPAHCRGVRPWLTGGEHVGRRRPAARAARLQQSQRLQLGRGRDEADLGALLHQTADPPTVVVFLLRRGQSHVTFTHHTPQQAAGHMIAVRFNTSGSIFLARKTRHIGTTSHVIPNQ